MAAEACSGPYFVSLMDTNGDWATARSVQNVQINPSAGIQLYQDENCLRNLESTKFERGGNRLIFYLRTERVLTDGSLHAQMASFTAQEIPVEAQALVRLSLVGAPESDQIFLAQNGDNAQRTYDIFVQNTGNRVLRLRGIGSQNFSLPPGASTSSSIPFRFVGGSYPGTGGNCSNDLSLRPTESCRLRLEFNATSLGTWERWLSFRAESDSKIQEFSFPLKAETSQVLLPAKLGNSSPASQSLCIILNNGAVKCLGKSDGSLGIQSTSDRGSGTSTNSILMAENVVGIYQPKEVHTGVGFSCALFETGNVRCWGINNYGQLGLGSTTSLGVNSYNTPRNALLGTGRTARRLTLGESHACAVLDNGTVKCWGRNNFGQLGIGSNNTQGTVTGNTGDNMLQTDLALGEILEISAGQSHNCVISASKKIKCWGLNSFGQLGLGSSGNFGEAPGSMGSALPEVNLGSGYEPLQISASENHTCALLLRTRDQKRRIKCWGANSAGQLGLGDSVSRGLAASDMGDNLPELPLPEDFDPIAIMTNSITGTGLGTSCALSSQNKVKCWGDPAMVTNAPSSMIGDQPGELAKPEADIRILGSGSSGPVALTRSKRNFCALLKNQMIKCWGGASGADADLTPLMDGIKRGSSNLNPSFDAQLGSEELPLNRQSLVEALRVGPKGTCVTWKTGEQTCMGKISSRHVYSSPPLEDQSQNLHPMAPFKDFRLGLNFMCAIGRDDQVYCLGDNQEGQLGLGLSAGEKRDSFTSPVLLGTHQSVVQLSVGGSHACALFSDGKMKCWGSNTEGQLGLGDTVARGTDPSLMADNLPFVDLGVLRIDRIYTGENHNCADTDAGVKCWGSNSHGQLGLNDTNNRGDNPGEMGSALAGPYIDYPLPSFYSELSLGNRHTCILISDTQEITDTSVTGIKCFGKNDYGQLNLGDIFNRGDALSTDMNLDPWIYYPGTPIAQVSAGKDITCFIVLYPPTGTPDSTPITERRGICVGKGGYLGINNNANRGNNATMVSVIPLKGAYRGIVRLENHPLAQHTCALVQNERAPADKTLVAKCWGESDISQTGIPRGGANTIIGDESAEVDSIGPIPGPLMIAMKNGVSDYVRPGEYTYTVPPNVGRIRVAVWGAGGGGANAPAPAYGGASGAFSYREFAVHPGTQFQVKVGAGAEGLDPTGADLGTLGERGGGSHFARTDGQILMQAEGGTTGQVSVALATGGELNLAGTPPTGPEGAWAPMGGSLRLHDGMTTGLPALQGRFPGGGGGVLYDPGSSQSAHRMGGKGAPGRVLIESVPDSVTSLSSSLEPDQFYRTPGDYRYLVPPGVKRLRVQMWGGGGAGGSSTLTGAGGCGGGGGAWLEHIIEVKERNSYRVKVGQGGTPSLATSSSLPGGHGESSQFTGPSTNLIAGGGRGGGGAWSLVSQACEGLTALYSTGGVPVGGLNSSPGEAGQLTSNASGSEGGAGGSSPSGGQGGSPIGGCYPQSGRSPGGGGAGTRQECTGSSGGAGAPGLVIITPLSY